METDYSVLMSVYFKEKADFLRSSIDSMFSQTKITNDFVLICDGPLNDELDDVIKQEQDAHPGIINVVRLEKNGGLGNALKIGVNKCKNEFIARMDSDDIAHSDRCEKEFDYLNEHPEISIVGSNIEEFSTDVNVINSIRQVPETSEEIAEFAKKRNPFNHPSVMYRKSAVLECGNYSDVRYMQDYYLWVDMLINNKKGHNIQECLVSMRADSNLFKRRSGKLYVQIQVDLFRKMYNAGFISRMKFYKSALIRICSASAPNWLRKFMFDKVLRAH